MAWVEEDTRKKIHDKLVSEGEQLWFPPYFVSGAPVVQKLLDLALKYSNELYTPYDSTVTTLKYLQSHSWQKWDSMKQLIWEATLRVKIVGAHQAPNNMNFNLKQSGRSLQLQICTEMNIPYNSRVKFICHGSIIANGKTLIKKQGVSNNSLIMVIVPSSDPDSQKFEEELMKQVELIKEDAEFLAGQYNSLVITDQSGNEIQLPIEEKKSLAVAMSLHEKGRAALKRKQTTLALTLFHEADEQFSSCRSELLGAVDNAALLNLDIAWCYLLLGSAADIPDAAVRLDKCEKSLHKTYGPGMERLLSLKGATGNERVLFLRLHLLQGVVAYHQGNKHVAAKMLEKAKNELDHLIINDEDLSRLMDLGYSLFDARLGLRAHRGDVNAAYAFLHRRGEDRKERIRIEEEEEKLGKTANGQWVHLGQLKAICEMGYERTRAAEALKQTNNDIGLAVDYLQSDLVMKEEEAIFQVMTMGYPRERARQALRQSGGAVESAIENLSVESGHSSDEASEEDEEEETEEDRVEREAYERMAKDIPQSESDHLDTDLAAESEFLQQYLCLLNSC